MLVDAINEDRSAFWDGFEWALANRLPDFDFDDEAFIHGWTQGAAEKEGFFRESALKVRLHRTKRLLRALAALVKSYFDGGLDFGVYIKKNSDSKILVIETFYGIKTKDDEVAF